MLRLSLRMKKKMRLPPLGISMDFEKRILCLCDKLLVSYLYCLVSGWCAGVCEGTGRDWLGGDLACLCWLKK